MNRTFNYWWTKPDQLSDTLQKLFDSAIISKTGVCKSILYKTRPYLNKCLVDNNWKRDDIERLIRSNILNIKTQKKNENTN